MIEKRMDFVKGKNYISFEAVVDQDTHEVTAKITINGEVMREGKADAYALLIKSNEEGGFHFSGGGDLIDLLHLLLEAVVHHQEVMAEHGLGLESFNN